MGAAFNTRALLSTIAASSCATLRAIGSHHWLLSVALMRLSYPRVKSVF